MSGMLITVNFADGSQHSGTVFAKSGSLGEGNATIAGQEPAAPTIELLGTNTSPTTVSAPQQTVRVFGNEGDTVRVLHTEAALEPVWETLYDVDPYEANRVREVTHLSAVIPAGANYVDIPVTLTNNYDQGGLNHFVAVVDAGARTGSVSNVLVVQLDETASSFVITAESEQIGSTRTTASQEDPYDVNRDGTVTALDALMVINSLSRQSVSINSALAADQPAIGADVNRDGQVTAMDALKVINRLGQQAQLSPAAESVGPAVQLDWLGEPDHEEEEDRVAAIDTAISSLYESAGSEKL